MTRQAIDTGIWWFGRRGLSGNEVVSRGGGGLCVRGVSGGGGIQFGNVLNLPVSVAVHK